jgi:phytoene dehydrogenase-like protein
MKTYDAIVVGAGLAGLTSAAYLSRAGLNTLLIEKRPKTGGLVETFWYKDYAFDAGIRAFENSGIVFPMLKDLGIELDIIRNQVSIGVADQSVQLTSEESLEDYTFMLMELFPDNISDIFHIKLEIRKVMEYMSVLYGIDNPLFLSDMDLTYLRKTLLPWFIKYQVNIRKAGRLNEPIEQYMTRFTSNQSLIDMIIQHFFKQTPTFFALSYFSLYLDYCYPIGGTGVLAKKMTEYIASNGGEVMTGVGVVRLDGDQHQVELTDGQVVEYKQLIWSADQRTLYQVTEGINTPDFEKQRRLSQDSRGGDSILTFFVGVDRPKEYFEDKCGAHMFYTPQTIGLSSLPDWRGLDTSSELYDWANDYLERTTYEISCPVIRDQQLAPEGKTGLIISTLMDYDLVQRMSQLGEYEQFKQSCTQKMIDVFEKSLFPGITESLEFSLCATPMTIERETHNTDGAITGWSFTNPEMPSENRFKKISRAIDTPIPDVYQAGQWTFSPSGLPVSIVTGKLAANQLVKAKK